jgi:hypothetical protein
MWLSSIALCLTLTHADDRALYELLRDAQVTNAASLPTGIMSFRVVHELQRNEPPIEVKGTLTWEGSNALWAFRMTDPKKRATDTFEHAAPLDAVRPEYILVEGQTIHWYNAYRNVIFVNKFDSPADGGASFYLFAVGPQWQWYRCCPPSHLGGRLFKDLIGPDSPAMSADSTMTVRKTAAGPIEIVRDDPGVGTLTMTFDPALGANLTEIRYLPRSNRARGMHGVYTWRQLPDGRCVLDSCECQEMQAGSNTEIRSAYRFQLLSFDPEPHAATARLDLNALREFVPRNALVIDHVAKKTYSVFPNATESPESYRAAAAILRSRGFLKKP